MELNGSQLVAIAKWVRAGGSLCLLPSSALDQEHLEYLNELAQSGGSDIIFVLDEQGRLSASGAADNQHFALLRIGLGRVAIGLVSEQKSIDIKSPQWQQMSSFLWKFNGLHSRSISEKGTIDNNQISRAVNNDWGAYEAFDSETFTATVPLSQVISTTPSSAWTETLTGQLMPKDFRFVPLWLISSLLLLFLVVIGPVDYFVLGALKLRKYTWIVFPITAFAFAYATVWTANTYMGQTNETRSYEIFDIGKGGEVLRANRLELHYNGTPQHIETDVSGGLYTALNISISQYSNRNSEVGAPPVLTGKMPQKLIVSQDIPQWTPRLNRQFWIAPGTQVDIPTKFDWDSVRISDLDSPANPAALNTRFKAVFGPDCSVYVLNQLRVFDIAVNGNLMTNPHTNFPF